MARLERREEYFHATIDTSDMTVTEYTPDGTRTYSIRGILERWNGVSGIEIRIRHTAELPAAEVDAHTY